MKKIISRSLEAVHTHTHTHTSSLIKREKYNKCKNQAQKLYGSIFGIEKQKSQSAITLIALVITIIITLILAGVVIASLSGENGLLSMAKKAGKKYQISQMQEELNLRIADIRIEEEKKQEEFTKEDLTQLNNEETDVGSVEEFPIEVIYKMYKFSIDSNYEITYIGESDGTVVTYTTTPEGYTNQDTLKVNIVAKNPKGIQKIEYPDADSLLANNQTEISIDYTVTANGTYTFKITDIDGTVITKDIVIELIDKVEPLDFNIETQKSGTTVT